MRSQQEVISMVIAFAVNAHKGQMRKYADQPYVEHPIRVMERCQQYSTETPVLLAAILHDVLEDTSVDENALRDFLHNAADKHVAEKTLKLVVELTDVYTKQNYPASNRAKRRSQEIGRLSKVSGEAQTIKYADIIDNTDVAKHDRSFARVYLKEARLMLEAMKDGNPQLRENAISLVDTLLQSLANHPHIS